MLTSTLPLKYFPDMSEGKAVIASASRTVFGRYRGGLSKTRPDDLLAFVMKDLMAKIPNLDSRLIDDVIVGDSNGAGEDNRNVARMGLLLAGLPVTIPAVTLNRLCGSGAEALVQAARSIACGDSNFILAGGVESMSRAPWIVERDESKPGADSVFHQSTVGWRLVNPLMPSQWTSSLGLSAQAMASEYGISRLAQDEWALRSHERALAAWSSGFHQEWATPVAGVEIDECIRPDSNLETLAGLKPAFSEDGSVTAGNSSPLNDGAVISLITSLPTAKDLGLEPLGTIISSQSVGVSPERFTTAPIYAIQKLLAKNNLQLSDIDVWEINEAFAAMVLTVLSAFPELDRDLVNKNGGAIALGHPIGASAGRAVIDCARELQRSGGRYGIAAACIGVGQGIAVLVSI